MRLPSIRGQIEWPRLQEQAREVLVCAAIDGAVHPPPTGAGAAVELISRRRAPRRCLQSRPRWPSGGRRSRRRGGGSVENLEEASSASLPKLARRQRPASRHQRSPPDGIGYSIKTLTNRPPDIPRHVAVRLAQDLLLSARPILREIVLHRPHNRSLDALDIEQGRVVRIRLDRLRHAADKHVVAQRRQRLGAHLDLVQEQQAFAGATREGRA